MLNLILNNGVVNSLNNVVAVMGIKNHQLPQYFQEESAFMLSQYDTVRLERACRFA